MLNAIILHGRLVRDPELRRTQSGVAVASTAIAVDRDYTKDGNREADFIELVAWRQTGELLTKHWTKGKEILISGRLQMRNWTDNQGQKRTTAEVVAEHLDFCGPKGDGSSGSASYGTGSGTGAYPSTSEAGPPPLSRGGYAGDFAPLEDEDGELPF